MTYMLNERELRDHLQPAIEGPESLEEIPRALFDTLRHAPIEPEARRAGLDLIHDWVDYSHTAEVDPSNPYAVRHHISQFANERLGQPREPKELNAVPLPERMKDGSPVGLHLLETVSAGMLLHPHVAVTGGVSRLGLKIHTDVDYTAELPISDVDAVFSADNPGIEHLASSFGVDVAGAKIVGGDIRSQLGSLVTDVDCTMNQTIIHSGKLYYTDQAEHDVREGNIRIAPKNDALFGAEGHQLSNGEMYLNRAGFYRGLSFLLRGKGDQLIVSQENIDEVGPEIGRYWLVMLQVKLSKMTDPDARYQAIGQWHELAKQMGVTEMPNAVSFLAELDGQYPGTNAGNTQTQTPERQARWIIGRLVSTAVSRLNGQEEFTPPDTYTPANITRPEEFAPYSKEAFHRTLEFTRRAK